MIFYNSLNSDRKRKRKETHSPGLILAQTGPTTAELCARPRPRWGLFRKTQSFWITASGYMHYLRESLTAYKETPEVLFLYTARSTTASSTT
jgi:hypothetical protein